jgi:hypothetical protein
MNNLPEVFQRAYLSPSLRLDEAADSKVEAPAHGITRTGPAKVSGRHLSQAPNAAEFLASVALAGLGVAPLAAHTITRESTGYRAGCLLLRLERPGSPPVRKQHEHAPRRR